MSQNTQWDGLSYAEFDFPYDLIASELSPEPRLSGGENSYVTTGGKLTKRFGTLPFDSGSSLSGYRIDRMITYETMGENPSLYLVASMYDFLNTVWVLKYKTLGATIGAWTAVPDYRSINSSTREHEMAISGGLVYVKGFPDAAGTEKLGSVILDGTSGTITTLPWGLLGPQTPAAIDTDVTLLTASITATDTTINVVSTSGFAGPSIRVQIDFEIILVSVASPTSFTAITRGFGGTTAASHADTSPLISVDWVVSAHPVTVNYGWTYAYAYKTITGQISNRSPLETNPDKAPSTTGAFFDAIPAIIVQGDADTTNIPTIVIYRTTDGGGTFYKLDEITNTGAGNIIYADHDLESGPSGGVFLDPIPDDLLDTFDLGPSTVSNSPPPTTVSPNIIGTDPVLPSTRIAIYQSRLWYGVENILYYSAQEELNEGIPEESWPSGAQNGRLGNFFRFQNPITNVQESEEALYVFTADATYKLTGSNRETFSFSPMFQNIGSPANQPGGVTRFNNTVAFISHDYRIYTIDSGSATAISDPLNTAITDTISETTRFDLKYFADRDKEWLILSSIKTDDPAQSRLFVYDVSKSRKLRTPFWNTPWGIQATSLLSARISESQSRRTLMISVFDAATEDSELVYLDLSGNTGSDYLGGVQTGFRFNVQFHQMLVPAGNHVNQLRVPGITPNVYGVLADRLQYDGDSDPTFSWYFDDLWTDPTYPVRVEPPARRVASKGFRTLSYSINKVAQHFSLAITKDSSQELFALLGLRVIWEPEGGI